jgi:hypothetical protein
MMAFLLLFHQVFEHIIHITRCKPTIELTCNIINVLILGGEAVGNKITYRFARKLIGDASNPYPLSLIKVIHDDNDDDMKLPYVMSRHVMSYLTIPSCHRINQYILYGLIVQARVVHLDTIVIYSLPSLHLDVIPSFHCSLY